MRRSVLVLSFLATVVALSFGFATADEDGFVSLFDGETMKGWQGDTKGYQPKDGAIVCTGQGSGNLFTDKEYADFELRFEFKLAEGANNGIGIRSPLDGNPAFDGIEIQVLDDGHEKYKGIAPYQAHGSVYGVIAAKRGFLKKAGEWNQETIIAKGNHFKVILNGETIVDGVAEKPIDGAKHPGLERKTGFIGFCGHGDHVEFRKLRIKELK